MSCVTVTASSTDVVTSVNTSAHLEMYCYSDLPRHKRPLGPRRLCPLSFYGANTSGISEILPRQRRVHAGRSARPGSTAEIKTRGHLQLQQTHLEASHDSELTAPCCCCCLRVGSNPPALVVRSHRHKFSPLPIHCLCSRPAAFVAFWWRCSQSYICTRGGLKTQAAAAALTFETNSSTWWF